MSPRYLDGFGAMALTGLRIGIYEHSSVARDILGEIMRALRETKLITLAPRTFSSRGYRSGRPKHPGQLAIWIKTHGWTPLCLPMVATTAHGHGGSWIGNCW
jgi:phosphomannomutase